MRFNRWTLAVFGVGVMSFAINASAEEPVANQTTTAKPPVRIEKKAADFTSTAYLSAEESEKVKKSGYLIGCGEAEYTLDVPATGWYELYVTAAQWPTDLFLDGKTLIYTPFESSVWETKDKGCFKVMNLALEKGMHTLKFSRPWHPGLPYMTKFYLQESSDLSGRCRLSLQTDRLAFRAGEKFTVSLQAGKGEKEATVILNVKDASRGGELLKTMQYKIPAGTGNFDIAFDPPTDKEGVFDLETVDVNQKHLDRAIQYCVIDTSKPQFPSELKKELVGVIDAVAKEPDFSFGPTRVVQAPCGAYRESGDKGREGGVSNASWFAYKLNLPSVQEPYLLEIEYPDDDRRTTPIVIAERYGAPEPALGYFTGGVYPLSGKMLTQEFYFTPRDTDPRVVFYNWDSGQRSALSKINVYKITGGFPTLRYGREGRMFGEYQEEPMRFLSFYGATSEGDGWLNFYKTTNRIGQMLNFAGFNLWNPTLAVYGNMLWPGKSIPGFQMGILPPGPSTLKEPIRKDVMRLMLLTCEKYGMNFVGDLHIPPSGIFMVTLDKRFGGKGSTDDDGPNKPWLTVSKKGEVGQKSPYKPYYNALHPGVQQWAAEVLDEIAQRYKDSPAFSGVSIRQMGWTFGGWQSIPSIDWGYDDFSLGLFESETGVKIPLDKNDPQRFSKRFDYLMQNEYKRWVDWRCKKMREYHQSLSKVLRKARPDLKLYIFLCDVRFDCEQADFNAKNWVENLRESGIDPALYADDPSIVIYSSRGYPDSGNRGDDQPLRVAESRDQNFSMEPLNALAKKSGEGTVSTLYFGTNHEGGYLEYEKLGYDPKEIANRSKTIYPDSTVYPGGIHYLERFANAMADGNFIWISDGSHGYALGQPAYSRLFMSEYRSLPNIGMKRLGNSDPVALWHGSDAKSGYFYLANRSYYEVEAEVAFPVKPKLIRLATGEAVDTTGNVLKLKVAPYGLIGFRSAPDAVPQTIKQQVPAKEKELLERQIQAIDKLIGSQPQEAQVVSMSPTDFQRAKLKLEEIRTCARNGLCWRAHQMLLESDMIKLYEAFSSYPPDLFHRKTPHMPEGAMVPEKLMDALTDKAAVEFIDAAAALPALAGNKALLLKADTATISVNVPTGGKYRIWCSYAQGDAYSAPTLLCDEKPLPILGTQEGTHAGMCISAPLPLQQGKRNISIKKVDGKVALLSIYVEPMFHELSAGLFRAVGPFQGVNGRINSQAVQSKVNEIGDPEKNPDITKSYTSGDKTLAWIVPKDGRNTCGSSNENYIDLYKTFGEVNQDNKGSISYAMTRIESPDDRDIQISFGVDYWAKLCVNGLAVLGPEVRPLAPPKKGESLIAAKLHKGINEILIKIHAGSAGSGFWMAISDPGDLKFIN